MSENNRPAFDALLTPEQREEIKREQERREARPQIEIPRDGTFANQVINGAAQRLMYISQTVESDTLAKLSGLLMILAAGKIRLPENCPHMAKYGDLPTNVFFLCQACSKDDNFYPMHLPIPTIIDMSEAEFAKDVTPFHWMGGAYGVLFVPSRLGLPDTWEIIVEKINSWSSEKQMMAEVEALDALTKAKPELAV